MGEITNGRVEDVTLSKKKTSLRVRIGDDWYGAYLPKKDDEDIQAALGKMVAVEWEDKGNFGRWINRWRFSADQTLPAGARPVTPHQGAAQRSGVAGDTTGARSSEQRATPQAGGDQPLTVSEPARQLSAEELKVVNGIVMTMIEHGNAFDSHPSKSEMELSDKLDIVSLMMKAIATTVREL